MMTTILVSHGNNRCKLLRVIPVANSSAIFQKSDELLTATLVSTQYPSTEEAAIWIDNLAHLRSVRSSSHRIYMHFVDFRHRFEEVVQSRSDDRIVSVTHRRAFCMSSAPHFDVVPTSIAFARFAFAQSKLSSAVQRSEVWIRGVLHPFTDGRIDCSVNDRLVEIDNE